MASSSDKRALILGIGGQDGSYLADLLLEKGYEVHGLVRRSSSSPGNLWRLRGCLDRVTLHDGDLFDPGSVCRTIDEACPNELYNCADQDHVGFSYATPAYSMDVTAAAVARPLEYLRRWGKVRIFQPVSATMFGCAPAPQNERTPFAPQSPYAVAKVAAFYLCQHYRREYGLHVSTAILYNHDSLRRTGDYLLHKVCRAAVAISRGSKEKLHLGDLAMDVDIGWAPEYVDGIWRLMQLDQADDFVMSSGDHWSIQEVVRDAFSRVGLWWQDHVVQDAANRRPGPAPRLIGDSTKAKKAFGWEPQVKLDEVIGRLMAHYQEQA